MFQILLTYIINAFIVFLFFPILDIVVRLIYPFSWRGLMQTLHLANVMELYIFMACTIPLIVGLLYLTPPVQWLLAFFVGRRKPTHDESAYLEPLMQALCTHAARNRASLRLYVVDDNELNAFAWGYNRITVTTASIHRFSKDELIGILAHELGHLTHRDSLKGSIMMGMEVVGNIVIRLMGAFMWILTIFTIIPVVRWGVLLLQYLFVAVVYVIRYFIQMPAMFSAFITDRKIEYAADNYAVQIGLGQELRLALIRLGTTGGSLVLDSTKGWVDTDTRFFWEKWKDSHPSMKKRIDRLNESIELYELKQRIKQQ